MITREMILFDLLYILKENAPVRGMNIPAGRKMPNDYLKPTKQSPYPGNLKNNGIRITQKGDVSKIEVGGVPAVYAVYTETKSFRKNWMQKSNSEFLQKLQSRGAIIK